MTDIIYTNLPINIESYNGILVLRDDLLVGGTKAVLIPNIIKKNSHYNEFVYATTVYGAFQIALTDYNKGTERKTTIFCAERNQLHENTLYCHNNGAQIYEVPMGFLKTVQSAARRYCINNGAYYVEFGGKSEVNKQIIAHRVRKVISEIGFEPDEIFCVIGSGCLVESILLGTEKATVYGISTGKHYDGAHERLKVIKYPLAFDRPTRYIAPFKSTANYDRKGWEYCNKYRDSSKKTLFWNVY